MMELNPISNWEVQNARKIDYTTCAAEWTPWRSTVPPGPVKYVSVGESVEKPEHPLQGNHINALPYAATVTELKGEYWLAESKSISTLGSGKCVTSRRRGDGRTFGCVQIGDLGIKPSVDFTAAEKALIEDIAVTKAVFALRKADASIPMLYKERVQSINMLKTHATRGLDLILRRQNADVKRWRKFKGTRNQKKFLAQLIAQEHLAFIFGMMPLIDDLQGLAENLVSDQSSVIKGRGRMRRVKDKVPSKTVTYPEGFATLTTSVVHYSVRVSLRADITNKILSRGQKLGANPLYTVYDFIPLSFVVSWFSNFGTWLGSLDPLLGAEFTTGSTSILHSNEVETRTYPWPVVPGRIGTGNGQTTGSLRHYRRKAYQSEPQPVFRFYNNFSLYSVLASASLFVQRKVKLTRSAIRVKPFRYKSKKPAYLPPISYKP